MTFCYLQAFLGGGREGGRAAKRPPTSFSPKTSKNVSASPKLTNLNQDHPSKKVVFLVISYKIEVITSLIEILEFPNFGHMNTSTT